MSAAARDVRSGSVVTCHRASLRRPPSSPPPVSCSAAAAAKGPRGAIAGAFDFGEVPRWARGVPLPEIAAGATREPTAPTSLGRRAGRLKLEPQRPRHGEPKPRAAAQASRRGLQPARPRVERAGTDALEVKGICAVACSPGGHRTRRARVQECFRILVCALVVGFAFTVINFCWVRCSNGKDDCNSCASQ